MHSLRLLLPAGRALRVGFFVAVAVVFAGCLSIPPEVARLSRTASAKTAELGAAHASDLERLAAYEENRSQQLAAAFASLRSQVAPLRASEQEARKAAAKADLLARFDQEAGAILTNEFWIESRARTATGDALRLLEQIGEADGRLKNAVAHEGDRNARNAAIAELRKIQLLESGLNTALASAFAKTSQAVAAKRRAFVLLVEQEFAKIPKPKAAGSKAEAGKADETKTVASPASGISTELMARAGELRTTYTTLIKGQDELTRFLTTEDKELAKSFAEGVIEKIAKLPEPAGIPAASATTDLGTFDNALAALIDDNPSIGSEVEKTKTKLDRLLPGILAELRTEFKNSLKP